MTNARLTLQYTLGAWHTVVLKKNDTSKAVIQLSYSSAYKQGQHTYGNNALHTRTRCSVWVKCLRCERATQRKKPINKKEQARRRAVSEWDEE